jgi:hypothetical protein
MIVIRKQFDEIKRQKLLLNGVRYLFCITNDRTTTPEDQHLVRQKTSISLGKGCLNGRTTAFRSHDRHAKLYRCQQFCQINKSVSVTGTIFAMLAQSEVLKDFSLLAQQKSADNQ